jgi:hypothetical protein
MFELVLLPLNNYRLIAMKCTSGNDNPKRTDLCTATLAAHSVYGSE